MALFSTTFDNYYNFLSDLLKGGISINIEQSQSIEQLAATVAHEIKNPLALIKANIQLIELEDPMDFHKKRYSLIYNELDKISELVQHFMHLLKPVQYHFEAADLIDLIDDVVDLFTISLGTKYKIDFEPSMDTCNVYCDKKMIKQVMMNIIQNSIESFSHQDGSIKIGAFTSEKYAVVSICDNGPGFEDEALQRIGTPFFTTKKNGHGIGLVLCKKVVEDHNGLFTIAGAKNQGTTVTLSFPI